MTRGRYYFSPPNTPFVPFGTMFGSATWDGNGTIDGTEPPGTLPFVPGQVRGAPTRWDSGALPVDVPQAITVGSEDCLTGGDEIADGVEPEGQTNGFPNLCFITPPPANEDYVFGFSVWNCPTQAFWADQIALLYNGQFTDVTNNCQNRFAGATVTIVKQGALYPAYVLIVHPQYVCLASTGTTTLQQALVQVIQGFSAPQDFGQFGTALVWYNFANAIIAAITAANALDGRPIMLAGHSYGGAAVMVAIAQLGLLYPRTQTRYMTFGSPKPGDIRLRKLLDMAFDGLSMVNDDDWITALPPSADVMDAMTLISTFGFVPNWTKWSFPPETTFMYQSSLLKNTYPRYDSLAFATYITAIITTGQLPTLVPHAMSEYQKRIGLRCTAFIPDELGLVLGWNNTAAVIPVIITPCCPTGTPQTVAFALSGFGGTGTSLNGVTGHLGYNVSAMAWEGQFLSIVGLAQLALACNITSWAVVGAGAFTFGGGSTSIGCGVLTVPCTFGFNHGITTGVVTITP